jgi:hypothetical protein
LTVSQPRPRGRCPYCKRVVTGRAAGQDAGVRYVILLPHNKARRARRPEQCQGRGEYRKVERLPDDTPTS